MQLIFFFFLNKNAAKFNQQEINDPPDLQPTGRCEEGRIPIWDHLCSGQAEITALGGLVSGHT